MNIKKSIEKISLPKRHDSQLNVLISKDDLLAFKAYAKIHGTDASKLTRAFIQVVLEREVQA
ncbi:hypothetical protein KDX14_17495 [Burkholderia cenocepacia]|uniref:hypothetical protein n=1 Tax=Burkholderia cenocepacia TaxID=95486 RepID=UPI001B9AED1E|nr:hypothetical protein [Burkholderia cenocepacia]MBR8071302.1 hypothetical protein [Burkholderia cenocepacia]